MLPRRDLDFLLYELLGVEQLAERPRFAGQGREVYDAVLDMARTSVNVLGNCLATAVVARWEGVDLSKAPDLLES